MHWHKHCHTWFDSEAFVLILLYSVWIIAELESCHSSLSVNGHYRTNKKHRTRQQHECKGNIQTKKHALVCTAVFQLQLCTKMYRVVLRYLRRQLVTEDCCTVISSQETIEESSRRKEDTVKPPVLQIHSCSLQFLCSKNWKSQGIPLWVEGGKYAQPLNWEDIKT